MSSLLFWRWRALDKMFWPILELTRIELVGASFMAEARPSVAGRSVRESFMVYG